MNLTPESHFSFHALPPELWARILSTLVSWDYGTGENARMLSLTCRTFHALIGVERWRVIALRDFDRIARFTRLLISTPEDSLIRKIENLFVLFSEDWFGEFDHSEDWLSEIDDSRREPEDDFRSDGEEWETSSLTSEERQELEDDKAWFLEQTSVEKLTLVSDSGESQLFGDFSSQENKQGRYFVDLVQQILQLCGSTLKHLHWHTAAFSRVTRGISLPSYIHLPELQVLVTSRSSRLYVAFLWRETERNELAEHLLWTERYKPGDIKQDGDIIPCMKMHLPALRMLHIGLPVAHRPPLDELPYMDPPGQPVQLTEAWFSHFRDIVLEGCPSLQSFGLSYLDGIENRAEWCSPHELDQLRLSEMYSKLMYPDPNSPLEKENEDEVPTAHEMFDLWCRFLKGDEQAGFDILPRPNHPDLFPNIRAEDFTF
ncbi:hypothetical protein DL96DRAFT_1556821 [Flagelloscypha sp. PMI_526]|nr:hypothetical protein DL96DRAFT_1556821 [Flagelloscypha sp. PMI_526]